MNWFRRQYLGLHSHRQAKHDRVSDRSSWMILHSYPSYLPYRSKCSACFVSVTAEDNRQDSQASLLLDGREAVDPCLSRFLDTIILAMGSHNHGSGMDNAGNQAS
jgi:hypothetical protein